jgi:hypothetical protein
MKGYLIPILIVMTAFLAVGCDRFAHNFLPPDTVDFQAELFTPLQDAFDAQPEAGIETIMGYYTEDYLHFGLNKADRRSWLEGIYLAEPDAEAAVSLLNAEELTDTTAIANWRLVISSPGNRAVIADSTFTSERLAKRSGKWMLKGNQMTCELPTPKQHIIIEYFTFLTCPNCPAVEDKLYELYLQYPGRFSYLEHHVNDVLAIPGDQAHSYYNYPSFPGSVIQGETVLNGSSQAILDEYDNQAENLSQMDSPFLYIQPWANVEGQTISGAVQLQMLATEFDFTNLVLNYVLIERETSYQNVAGHNVRNVIRAQGSKPITEADLSNPITFSLASTVPIPDDASIVLFVQTKPATFANNATIHSGVEFAITE